MCVTFKSFPSLLAALEPQRVPLFVWHKSSEGCMVTGWHRLANGEREVGEERVEEGRKSSGGTTEREVEGRERNQKRR